MFVLFLGVGMGGLVYKSSFNLKNNNNNNILLYWRGFVKYPKQHIEKGRTNPTSPTG